MLSLNTPPRWDVEGRDWPLRSHSQFVEAAGYCWHVQRLGQGPVALLLHGTGAATHSFAGLAMELAADFEVILLDLPGHGFTRAPAFATLSLSRVAGGVHALLSKLGVKPDIIIGHSAGAAIMVRLIASHAVEPAFAVSINGALSPFGGPAGLLFPLFAKMMYYNPLTAKLLSMSARDPDRVAQLIKGTGSVISPQTMEQYGTLLKCPGHVAGALGLMANWDLSSMPALLSRTAVPITFVAAENDKAVPPADAARMAEHAPLGQHILWQGLGHLAHEEAPDRVAALVRDCATNLTHDDTLALG